MFIILLNYTRPLADIDRFIGEHRQFLERYYASGHLLISGRRNPRSGGVIIAKADTRAEVEAIIQHDPFYREKLADYEIIEFSPTMSASLFARYLDSSA